ncbi:MAG: alpha/beta hydrolase [Planctomycetaceae bacterium]
MECRLRAAEPATGIWGYPAKLPGSRIEVYKTIGNVKLNAYIYEPKNHEAGDSKPAIVFFFGGGWRGGTPGQFHPHCTELSQRGLVAITVDYRVLNRQKATPQQCVSDAKSAIRWTRKNAKRLGIDPKKTIAAGGSAGGHLAAAGVVPGFDEKGEDLKISSVPNAMAIYNPAVMLAPLGEKDLLGPEKTASIAERCGGNPDAISPIHHVRKGLPPTIIFHGTADEAVPCRSSRMSSMIVAMLFAFELLSPSNHDVARQASGCSSATTSNSALR